MTIREYIYDAEVGYTDVNGDPQTLSVSTHGRTTGPVEGPFADTELLGRLVQPADFDESMYGAATATRGPKEPGNGMMIIANADGYLDALRRATWSTNLFGVHRLLYLDGVYDSSSLIMSGYLEPGEGDEDTITFQLRDRNHILAKPALPDVYAGTNTPPSGIEGVATTIKGQQKPRVFGQVYNVTPYAANNEKHIYQVDGQGYIQGFRSGWTIQPRDQYFPLVLDTTGNYADLTAMEAVAPSTTPTSKYRVCPSLGAFRLGSAPVGKVTCDVANPADPVNCTPSATTGLELHAVMRYVAYVAGALTADGTCDASALDDIPAVGIYVTGDMTWLQVMNILAASANASWSLGSDTLTLTQLTDPSGETPGATFTRSDMNGDLKPVRPTDSDKGKPVWRVKVQYKPNGTVMQEGELAGAVTLDERTYLAQEYLTVTATDTDVLDADPLAPEIIVTTQISNATDAQALADLLLAQFGVWRDMFVAPMPLSLDDATTQLGKFIRIEDHPRYDLSAGKNFQIIGRSIDAAGSNLNLTIWG